MKLTALVDKSGSLPFFILSTKKTKETRKISPLQACEVCWMNMANTDRKSKVKVHAVINKALVSAIYFVMKLYIMKW